MRRNKYFNHKIVNKYGKFDSKKEYERYLILLDMQSKGEIFELKRQPEFVLIPYQKGQKRNERQCKYIADFEYLDQKGTRIVEDVKSEITKKQPEYIIKRKLMHYLKGIEICEI